jgi:hypothetical protein
MIHFFSIIGLLLAFMPANKEKILFEETFTYPDGVLPSHFWSEGCQASIQNGRLFVDADTTQPRVATVWLDKKFSGNIKIEFDVQVVASSDTANNINNFVMYSHPQGKSLRETSGSRKSGNYPLYHELNGYIFTYLAVSDKPNARFRFRDCPGFNLVDENFTANCKQGKTYHITIIKKGNRFQYWTDDTLAIDKIDNAANPVHHSGLFGFRTWHTALWWDNLVVTQLN